MKIRGGEDPVLDDRQRPGIEPLRSLILAYLSAGWAEMPALAPSREYLHATKRC
jgi:hypothetical protein